MLDLYAGRKGQPVCPDSVPASRAGTEQGKVLSSASARHPPDALLISSAFAGAGFISRAIGDRLDLMIQTGIDGIDTLDPPPLGTVDLQQAKAQFGDRVFFKGNLDAVQEMLMADDASPDIPLPEIRLPPDLRSRFSRQTRL